jgi:hypothetical protein
MMPNGAEVRNPNPGTPGGGEVDRIVAMLGTIRLTLESLIKLQPSVLPETLRLEFEKSLPHANECFDKAIAILNNEQQRPGLMLFLKDAGFTGVPLATKEMSLTYQMDMVDRGKAILSLSESKSTSGKLLKRGIRLIMPGFKVMNSIMGSLIRGIPILEGAKEIKEHVEAGYESVAASL